MVTDILDRPAPPPDRTVRYGPGPDQVIDLRLPSGPVTGPPVVFFHGGFWRARYDRAHVGPLAADLAARGHPVAVIEYRRVGQSGGGWPGTLDDVRAAVGALPDLAGARFAEPVLAGHSAGGHLALWAARYAPARGVLALAPVADLALGYELNLGAGAVAALLGGGPADVPDRYAVADPAGLLPLGVPSAIVHGQEDQEVPVAVSRAYLARAVAAGDRIHLVELPDIDHFAVIDPCSPAWSTVHTALSALA